MTDYAIVSGATRGSVYERCMEMHGSLGDRFTGYLRPEMSWGEGTKIKPDIVLEAFANHPVVMWIDADCDLNPPSGLPDGDWDIAVTRDRPKFYKNPTSVAFILFRDTGATRRFLALWKYENRHAEKDHPAFTRAMHTASRELGLKVGDMTQWLRGHARWNTLRESS